MRAIKSAALSFTGAALLLFACNDADNNHITDTDNNNGDSGPDNENNYEENDQQEIEPEENVTSVIDSALEAEEEREGLYVHQQTKSRSGEEEVQEVITEEEIWLFPREDDDSVFEHRIMKHEGPSPTEYIINDGEGTLHYTEGESEAHLIEEQRMDGYAADLSGEEPMILEYLDTHRSSYEGTEDINGYTAHHISFRNGDEEVEYWFEQDSYFLLRHISSLDEQETEVAVLDYELDPEFDEALIRFYNVINDDTEIIETDRETFMKEQMND
ncbi:DUF2092 domain-containing protein [Salisediminibacterium beveridgei]|uniref:Outer membrane lipoprotein-sorting protein n=1 Tax=Salisediminibacterium beveridgei TaxID=632773 RepID=A0A1D7QS25_9BACI|nr:DUF2092 domain-containing protein [Salisediminibacterium beveridgei]AOM81814.1 hypothetical protein BBEV_0420 [Salisediminibacterium beveridgei]